MFARCFIYKRAHIRMCMYIQTYIYIGRSVYTMHYRGGRGGRFARLAMHIHTRPMVSAHGTAAARAICSRIEAHAKEKQTALRPVSWGTVYLGLKYAVCKVYSLVFFLVYDFRVYLRSLYIFMS